MILRSIVIENRYFDSVFLMSLAGELKREEGILDASAIMGTDSNKDLLRETNMLDEAAKAAAPNDLILTVKLSQESAFSLVEKKLQAFLTGEVDKSKSKKTSSHAAPKSIEEGVSALEGANLLHISIPGAFVRNEALRAIDRGLNLFIFSDNVSIAEELEIKQAAKKKGLLVMGPDCGTSIINGIALGFANVVPTGPLAVIGASGTGIQEITSLAARRGIGIAQAIGLGGRDLKKEIGAISMLQALDMIETQAEVKILCLVSKPADPTTVSKIMQRVAKMNLPVVICFLGGNPNIDHPANVHMATRLDEAVDMVEAVLAGKKVEASSSKLISDECMTKLVERKKQLPSARKLIKGLYSGGTLCDEALFLAKNLGLSNIQSNLIEDGEMALKNDGAAANLFLDLGDDKFTRGRPHPMIEFSYRMDRIREEAKRPETAVILLDLVIGYGSHLDPLSQLLPVMKDFSKPDDPIFVISITGTEKDPQNYTKIRTELKNAGAWMADSNAQACVMALEFVKCC